MLLDAGSVVVEAISRRMVAAILRLVSIMEGTESIVDRLKIILMDVIPMAEISLAASVVEVVPDVGTAIAWVVVHFILVYRLPDMVMVNLVPLVAVIIDDVVISKNVIMIIIAEKELIIGDMVEPMLLLVLKDFISDVLLVWLKKVLNFRIEVLVIWTYLEPKIVGVVRGFS